jgi:hypothetical protein
LSGLPATPPAAAQPDVERVDACRGEIADCDVANVGMQVAVEDGSRLANGGWRPSEFGDGEPSFEEFAHRRSDADRAGRSNTRNHRSKLMLSVGASSSDGRGSVDPSARVGVGCDEHAEFP